MGRKRPTYTAEFKAEALQLVRDSDRPINELALDLGVSDTTLYRWLRQSDIDAGNGPEGALTTDERQELARLRRELRMVKMERDFLKKVSAFFAKENS